jgi:hypothetical protein
LLSNSTCTATLLQPLRYFNLYRYAEAERETTLRLQGAAAEVERNAAAYVMRADGDDGSNAGGKPCPPQTCPPQPDCSGAGRALFAAEDEDVFGGGGALLTAAAAAYKGVGEGEGEDAGSVSGVIGAGGRALMTQQDDSATDPFIAPLFGGDLLDFKVFVHDLPEEYNEAMVRGQRRCLTDQYGTEVRFHRNLLTSAVRTLDPAEADFFFVPIYGECYLFKETQRSGGGPALDNTARWYKSALKILSHERGPWWNRTQGGGFTS